MQNEENQSQDSMSRRTFGLNAVGTVAVGAATTISATSVTGSLQASAPMDAKTGRLKQSVCKWCYSKLSLEAMCKEAVQLGLVGIDLLTPKDFPTLKQHGLVCTMVSSHSLTNGLCDEKYHEDSLKAMNEAIPPLATATSFAFPAMREESTERLGSRIALRLLRRSLV